MNPNEINTANPKTWVYALFATNGRCFYVVRTANLPRRAKEHARAFPKLSMKVIRTCARDAARRIEGQVIRAYWRKFQAAKNRYHQKCTA